MPNLRKTKLCLRFSQGCCAAGADCKFAHSDQELRATVDFYKTSQCSDWAANGECSRGDSCRYAHGVNELRAPGGGAPTLVAMGSAMAKLGRRPPARSAGAKAGIPPPPAQLSTPAISLAAPSQGPPIGAPPPGYFAPPYRQALPGLAAELSASEDLAAMLRNSPPPNSPSGLSARGHAGAPSLHNIAALSSQDFQLIAPPMPPAILQRWQLADPELGSLAVSDPESGLPPHSWADASFLRQGPSAAEKRAPLQPGPLPVGTSRSGTANGSGSTAGDSASTGTRDPLSPWQTLPTSSFMRPAYQEKLLPDDNTTEEGYDYGDSQSEGSSGVTYLSRPGPPGLSFPLGLGLGLSGWQQPTQ
jgi:hypothetical protein